MDVFKKNPRDPTICCQETHFSYVFKDTEEIQSEWAENDIPCKWKPSETRGSDPYTGVRQNRL